MYHLNQAFLTNWTLSLTFVYFLIMSFTKPSVNITTRYSVLFNMVLVAEGFIFVFFWTVLFVQIYNRGHGWFRMFGLFFAHIFPPLVITLDFVFNRIVIRSIYFW